MTGCPFRPEILVGVAAVSMLAACEPEPSWPPGVQEVPPISEPLSAREELETFFLPPGYRLELVASEPDVIAPVTIDFDADGRLWVVEMPGYTPTIDDEGFGLANGRIVVLEDEDWDGEMDRRTVFLDSLVLPRLVRVLDRGVLVGAPPYLWLAHDRDGDLRADSLEVVREDYGDPRSDAEHNANGLLWGLDNWMHSSWYEGQLRVREKGFEFRHTDRRGQWGVGMDDYGNLFRGNNTNPLRGDLVSAHYYARHPNLTRTRGLYEEVAKPGPVWPVRPTPGLTFGYSSDELRPDSTLRRFSAANSPTAYRGDRLPAELLNNVFVAEPTGNLVRRYLLEQEPDGSLRAESAYVGAEFIASTDERFRPVHLATGPDGTLYVVDMYRGIVQHAGAITTYLANQIRARKLEQPQDHGRIWRVVHETTERDERPRLSTATPAELAAHLAHPNGWWRSTAQRLLVERRDTSVGPLLREAAVAAGDERARLHALWTLDGIGAADPATLARLLDDPSSHLRAAAIRISEPWLAGREHPLRAQVLARQLDPSPAVRRQLTASLGELDEPVRKQVLGDMLARYPDDPVLVDLAVSGLRGEELAVLERLLPELGETAVEAPIQILAATVLNRGEPQELERVFAWVADDSHPDEQRLALLAGLRRQLPGVPRGADYAPLLELKRRPGGLLVASRGADAEVRAVAASLLEGMKWPGKPADPRRNQPRSLTAGEQALYSAGEQVYRTTCMGCHLEDGQGTEGVAGSLVGSPWVNGNPARTARIVLHGKEGRLLMPPLGQAMSDEEIAQVLTYIRRAWGNTGLPVEPAFVGVARGKETGRQCAWSEPELLEVWR